MKLEGAVAIVTGGSGGLGQRICHSLGAAGANVAVGYSRSRDKAEQVATELREARRPVGGRRVRRNRPGPGPVPSLEGA